MKNKLRTCCYLDDTRTPTETIPGYKPWDVVRNYNEFTEYILRMGIPDLISFDHDLGEEHMNDYFSQLLEKGFQQPDYASYKEKTGLDCAGWLIDYCQEHKTSLKKCSVHSANPVGAANIQSMINGFKKHMDEPQDCYLGKHPFKV